jgi:hypothetical protein
MLSDLLVNSVTVTVNTYSNVSGVRTPTGTSTAYAASVQPMTARTRDAYGIEGSETGYIAYFASDPGVKAGDSITWGTATLQVLGPASNMAGRTVGFKVACRGTR